MITFVWGFAIVMALPRTLRDEHAMSNGYNSGLTTVSFLLVGVVLIGFKHHLESPDGAAFWSAGNLVTLLISFVARGVPAVSAWIDRGKASIDAVRRRTSTLILSIFAHPFAMGAAFLIGGALLNWTDRGVAVVVVVLWSLTEVGLEYLASTVPAPMPSNQPDETKI